MGALSPGRGSESRMPRAYEYWEQGFCSETEDPRSAEKVSLSTVSEVLFSPRASRAIQRC